MARFKGSAVVNKRFYAMGPGAQESGGRFVDPGERVDFMEEIKHENKGLRQDILVGGVEVLNIDNPTMPRDMFTQYSE